MGIYIEGMEMPIDGCHHLICIYADGTVATGGREYRAVPIHEPHGRLIDADALYEEMFKGYLDIKEHDGISAAMTYACGMHDVKDAPTVIPAEEVKES